MNHQIKEFQNKIRKYHSLPEAIVIDCKRIGYPFYILHLDLTYLSNRDIELLEEFVMKCINNGLTNIRDISNFLGLDNHITEKVLSELVSRDLVKREEHLKLTQDGLDALHKQTILATVCETKTFYLDALNGKLTHYFSFKSFDSKKYSHSSLNKIIKKPRKNKVEDLIDYYQDIENFLQSPSNPNYIELVQVNSIEKVYLQWHEILLVLYKNDPSDNEIEYEIFSRNSIQQDYRATIEQLYSEGKKILEPIFKEMKKDDLFNESLKDFFPKISDDDIKNVEQITAKISSFDDPDFFTESKSQNNLIKNEDKRNLERQLQQLQAETRISEVIHTYELRNYLFKSLKEAQTRLMIVSPWIKRNVVNQEFLSVLEDTLKRKVKVYIIYGIKGSKFQNDTWSIKELEKLSDNYKNLKFSKTRNSHRKLVICDDKFAIAGSFNFLSFRADPNLTYRDELGIVLKDKQTIEDCFNSGIELMKQS